VSYSVDDFAEQQACPEQQPASVLHPLPSDAQQLAPALQQSEAQQLEPSLQQLESALQALPSLQQLELVEVAAQQLAPLCIMLYPVADEEVSAEAYTMPASPSTRVRTIALMVFISVSPKT
jgi:hypothetical protein